MGKNPLVLEGFIRNTIHKDTGHRVLRQANGPNLSNRCLLCSVSPSHFLTRTSTDSSTTMGIPLGRLPTRFHRHNLSCMYGSWSVVTSHSPQRQNVFKPLSWSLASQESQSWSKLSYSISCISHKWIMGRDLAKPLDALVSQELN